MGRDSLAMVPGKLYRLPQGVTLASDSTGAARASAGLRLRGYGCSQDAGKGNGFGRLV